MGYLRGNVAFWSSLNDAEQQRLLQLTQVFIAEKHWEGCGGIQLTDEIQVTIAAQACLLLLGRDHSLYEGVKSILVYPTTVVPPNRPAPLFAVPTGPVNNPSPLLGEAHQGGPVILVWDAILHGARDPRDGSNLVFHEFAHKIDMLDGAADGTPPLPGRRGRKRWAQICSEVFLELRERVERGEPTLLDPYAATNEAEFFAVATEAFFESSEAMEIRHPDLYQLLAEFYRQDPAARARRARGE
jgi:MtfA peptidase